MKLITRNQYLEKLINVIGTPDIKVITGVRRSGKSKLLESFKNYIEQNVSDHNIIQINFNLLEFDHLLEYRSLYDYINSQYVTNIKTPNIRSRRNAGDVGWIHGLGRSLVFLPGEFHGQQSLVGYSP